MTDGCVLEQFGAAPCRATPPQPSAGMRAALVDVTAAYHQERRHEGKWDACQHPRCQNARLILEGRGPFATLAAKPDAGEAK